MGWGSISPSEKRDANSVAVHTKDRQGWKSIQVKDATCFVLFFLKALLVLPRVLLPATEHGAVQQLEALTAGYQQQHRVACKQCHRAARTISTESKLLYAPSVR